MEISDTQLLEDIYLTRKEVSAYNHLRIGFQMLSELPENKGGQSRKYFAEFSYYDNVYENCLVFLNKLYGLAEERGIEIEE